MTWQPAKPLHDNHEPAVEQEEELQLTDTISLRVGTEQLDTDEENHWWAVLHGTEEAATGNAMSRPQAKARAEIMGEHTRQIAHAWTVAAETAASYDGSFYGGGIG